MTISTTREVWKSFSRSNWKKKQQFEVSNKGNVYEDKKNLKGKPTKFYKLGGYEVFCCTKVDGKTNLIYTHRIVAELFLEQDSEKTYVIHKDFNKLNNDIGNLKYVTRKELYAHNAKNPAVIKKYPTYSKLNAGRVRIIKRKIFDPNRKTRMRIIAKQFGISEMQLYRIKSGENWGHITDY